MHISEGVLSPQVLVAGGGLAAAGIAYSLKKMDYERVPQVAIVSAAFFVASFVHLPIGPVSVHLTLNGLAGILLGWAAFPAILVALFLQGVLFQFGGLTTLGVNTLNMALPAVICFLAFKRGIHNRSATLSAIAAFVCGFFAVALSGLMVAVSLIWSEESFFDVARVVVAGHLPVMVIEGLITAFIVGFLKRVKPDVLEAPHANSQFSSLE